MINILIVDDEPLARERLSRLIDKLDGFQALPQQATNGQEALTLIDQYLPEIVLLDINMPGLSGLEVAEQVGQRSSPPAIVFCTAFDDFALSAFKVHAVGYLMKPIRIEQLKVALEQAKRLNSLQLRALIAEQACESMKARSHINARTHKGTERIPVKSVTCFLADNKYVSVIHPHGEVLIEDSLKSLEEEFGSQFLRIHRNALINPEMVERMQKNNLGQFEIYLQGMDTGLTVSRRHASHVRKTLKLG